MKTITLFEPNAIQNWLWISGKKKIVLQELGNLNCKIFLFGSRATKANHRFSDMDIGIFPGNDFDHRVLYALKDKLADSIVPYKVDIVNFSQVTDNFKEEALKHIVWWKDEF